MLKEINEYNIKCLTSDRKEEYHEKIITNYNEELKKLEEIYNGGK